MSVAALDDFRGRPPNARRARSLIDKPYLREYFWVELGLTSVKRRHWMSVLFLLAAAVCVSAVPRADSPETTFNESDAPVNLAPPVLPGLRVAPPAVDPTAILPALSVYCPGCALNTLPVEPALAPRQRDHHSLLSLLCTLLI